VSGTDGATAGHGQAVMKLSNVLSIVFILAIAILLGWLSQRFDYRADWTDGNRASLTTASQRVVNALDAGTIHFTAFAPPGAERNRIRIRLGRFLRATNNVKLAFVDPATHPAQVRRLGIKRSGAVRVTYQSRSET